MKTNRYFFSCVLLAGYLLCAPQAARADALYLFSMNTTSLIGHPAGPFTLNFQLTDGSGTGNANNTVTLSNFSFGGGSPDGPPVLFGGAAGSLSGLITLTDSSFLNDFTQGFVPGNSLSFNLNVTTNANSGNTPDLFTFAILDGTGAELPTLGSLSDVYAEVTIGPVPLVETFGSDPTRLPVGGGNAIDISAPSVRQVQAIPEPATILLLGTGLSGVFFRIRKLRPGSAN